MNSYVFDPYFLNPGIRHFHTAPGSSTIATLPSGCVLHWNVTNQALVLPHFCKWRHIYITSPSAEFLYMHLNVPDRCPAVTIFCESCRDCLIPRQPILLLASQSNSRIHNCDVLDCAILFYENRPSCWNQSRSQEF